LGILLTGMEKQQMKLTKILMNNEDSLMFIFYLLGRLAGHGDDTDLDVMIDNFLNNNPDIKERVDEQDR